jgi:hypothetical protein
VKKHIGVRMSLQPDVILNFHTTEDKFPPRHQTMDIISLTYSEGREISAIR